MASISQRSEELRLCNVVEYVTISNPGFKVVSFQVHPLAEYHSFSEGDDLGFLTDGVKTDHMTSMSSLNSPKLFSDFTSIV
jgi:hypothetical protein